MKSGRQNVWLVPRAPRGWALGCVLAVAVACSQAPDGAPSGSADAGAVDGGTGSVDSSPTGATGGVGGSSTLEAGLDTGPSVQPCSAIVGESYESIAPIGERTDRPAAEHADLNLKLRGWSKTGGNLGLVDVGGPTDDKAPKLFTVFEDQRVPDIKQNFRVNNWDWSSNRRGGPIEEHEVHLVEMQVTPGEVLHLAHSGYEIAPGKGAMVLFADQDSITLKYTPEDNVVVGYALHVLDVCIEPSLFSRYQNDNANGRKQLPVVGRNQAFARARSETFRIAVRDTGAFMDPRVRKDWW